MRSGGLVCCLAVVLATVAGPADAAVLVRSSEETVGFRRVIIEYVDRETERNDVRVVVAGGVATFTDSVPLRISTAAPCTYPDPSDPRRAACRFLFENGQPASQKQVQIFAGDGADRASVRGAPAVLHGGSGDDVLVGSEFRDYVKGQDGDDTFDGREGDDVLESSEGFDDSDLFRGGPGRDLVSYYYRHRFVSADLDGRRDDGQRGERDRIARDVEDLQAGGAGSRLRGNDGPNKLFGYRGRDVLIGGGGPDELRAGFGSDLIFARDGTRDRVRCGGGRRDRARLDRRDVLLRRAGCERAKRG